MCMATKHGRMVTYRKGLLPIELFGSLITWSCVITTQLKTVVSPLLQCILSLNLAG